jgi:phospholipid transport system transporter-binding protein
VTTDTHTLRLPATLRQAQAMACGLQSFDSAALACLIELKRRALAGGWHIRVEGLPDRARRLAQVYGLAELI